MEIPWDGTEKYVPWTSMQIWILFVSEKCYFGFLAVKLYSSCSEAQFAAIFIDFWVIPLLQSISAPVTNAPRPSAYA